MMLFVFPSTTRKGDTTVFRGEMVAVFSRLAYPNMMRIAFEVGISFFVFSGIIFYLV